MHGSINALSKRKCTMKLVAIIAPGCNVICALVVCPARTTAGDVPDIAGSSVTTALTVKLPSAMFSSVHTLSVRFVSVCDNGVPSSFVPSNVTVTLLKSKSGSPVTVTSTRNVPVSTGVGGGGGGGGGGGSSSSGGGAG